MLYLKQPIGFVCRVFYACVLVLFVNTTSRADVLPQALVRAEATYSRARTNFLNALNDPVIAARLARACFELSELSSDNPKRSALAQEGVAAGRFATERAPENAAGFLYLGLNLGDLARSKKLSALSLLRQMERALIRAVELDAKLEYASPERSLGLLYLEAPGWPASVGSKAKAREHLARAVALVPDYPDNALSFMEALVKWNDKEALAAQAGRYRELLPRAKKQLVGPEWDQAWHDWEERWQQIIESLPKQN